MILFIRAKKGIVTERLIAFYTKKYDYYWMGKCIRINEENGNWGKGRFMLNEKNDYIFLAFGGKIRAEKAKEYEEGKKNGLFYYQFYDKSDGLEEWKDVVNLGFKHIHIEDYFYPVNWVGKLRTKYIYGWAITLTDPLRRGRKEVKLGDSIASKLYTRERLSKWYMFKESVYFCAQEADKAIFCLERATEVATRRAESYGSGRTIFILREGEELKIATPYYKEGEGEKILKFKLLKVNPDSITIEIE